MVFSGLNDRVRPVCDDFCGNLTGTAVVTRLYGCQVGNGKRLIRYDVKVTRVESLNTRRGNGYSVPKAGDQLPVSTWAFLPDAQPRGNCPAGTRAMTYAVRARQVKLQLESRLPAIPSACYSAPGEAVWSGAVATPTG